MSEINLENIETNTSGDLHYVGVVFESRYSSAENPDFYMGKIYNYATKRDLKEGEIITIETTYGVSRVKVINENADPSTFNFDLTLLKEI